MRRTRNSQTAGTRRRRSSSQPAPSPLLWRPRTPTANVTDLVDIVAHDLSNALTAATLSVSTMYRKGQVTEGTARPVRVLDEALRQMVRLVSDLRDVGQLSAGRLDVRADRLAAPYELIQRARDAARLSASARTIDVVCAANLPLVRVDEQRISQVFGNLIGNAVRFTPPRGQITVGAVAASRSREVIFFVRDTGSGISASDQRFVFLRRWQAAPPHGGTSGLGLAICKEIVEGHGGRIYVSSRIGEGSTFCFALPAHRELRQAVAGADRTETRC